MAVNYHGPMNPFASVVLGDCRDVLSLMDSESVDAVITDPPYEIGLVGKSWDSTGIAYDTSMWAEVLRVMKPGAFLFAFGSTRTWHRVAVAIEDAGFDIRDSIAWLYGSGKPTGMNLGRMSPEYDGWNTGLKPSHENIIVARKPFTGTVVDNMNKYGVGALHVDIARVGSGAESQGPRSSSEKSSDKRYEGVMTFRNLPGPRGGSEKGRFPSNVILSTETAHELDEQVPKAGASGRASGPTFSGESTSVARGNYKGMGDREPKFYGDKGGPSRFFPTFHYAPKAPKKERPSVNGVVHNSVKPLELMEWLVKLVSTGPEFVVLDPFAGSGTTVEACLRCGTSVKAIEKEETYIPLIVSRIERVCR